MDDLIQPYFSLKYGTKYFVICSAYASNVCTVFRWDLLGGFSKLFHFGFQLRLAYSTCQAWPLAALSAATSSSSLWTLSFTPSRLPAGSSAFRHSPTTGPSVARDSSPCSASALCCRSSKLRLGSNSTSQNRASSLPGPSQLRKRFAAVSTGGKSKFSTGHASWACGSERRSASTISTARS